MLQGRPLYDNPSDTRYYVPPAEWDAVVRALDRANNTLVVGARGAGKTTLLRQLQLALRNNNEPAVFVDATALSEPLELVARVRDALKGRPGSASSAITPAMIADLAGDPSPPPGGASRELYDALLDLGHEVQASSVLVDASASPQALFGVFGRMRDTVWQLPHRWLVAVDDGDRASALKPPADAFFDTVIPLPPVPIEDLLAILHRRTEELPDAVLAQIAADARGNPRAAIRAANDTLVHGRDPAGELSERAQLLDRAAQLGRPQGMLMAELLDLGQASPSDEVLLKRLGLTRALVSTLLQQLHEHGLVQAQAERSEGPGRPRTIYRPKLTGAA
jgi:energy-coupling factor transporter ATP-binding protein EcfA2